MAKPVGALKMGNGKTGRAPGMAKGLNRQGRKLIRLAKW